MQSANSRLSSISRCYSGTSAVGKARILSPPALILVLILLLVIAAHPYARADEFLTPTSVAAYYFDEDNKLLVVEGITRPRQMKMKASSPGWMNVMLGAICSAAHTTPDEPFEIGGKASYALYVAFEENGPPRLLATEDLQGVSRQVKPPPKSGTGGICCCTLIPCPPPPKKCCPCGTGCS